MKFLKSPKGAITFLLVALLVVSCFWIVKSEIRAASLQSRLDEHHEQLKKNEDKLNGLKFFMRSVEYNGISIDKKTLQLAAGKSILNFDEDELIISMRSYKLFLQLSRTDEMIQLKNGESKITLKEDNTEIRDQKGSKILVGDMTTQDGKIVYGISLTGKSGEQIQVRGDEILAAIPSQTGLYYLKLDAKKKLVELKKDNSIIRFEGDDISIEAPGDINITSKNGKVNINGKR